MGGGGVVSARVGNGSCCGSCLILNVLLGSLSTTTDNLLRPKRLIRAASFASSFWRRSWRRGLLLRPILEAHAFAFLGAPDEADEVEDVVTGVVDADAVELVVGVDVYRPRRLYGLSLGSGIGRS